MNIATSACFSGYREEKFPFLFQDGIPEYEQLKADVEQVITAAVGSGIERFYTGACYGFDILAGETVLRLRDQKNKNVKLVGVLPFENQAQLWKEHWRDRYFNMLEYSDEVITLQPRYTRGCYCRRNEFLVDHSCLLICYHNGQEGGTEQTIRYAQQQELSIINLCKEQQQAPCNHLFVYNFVDIM